MLDMIVQPIPHKPGFYPKRGIKFRSTLDGRVVYEGLYPHFGAAKAISRGPDDTREITTYAPSLNGSGALTPVFRSTVAQLAALGIEERKAGKIRVVKAGLLPQDTETAECRLSIAAE